MKRTLLTNGALILIAILAIALFYSKCRKQKIQNSTLDTVQELKEIRADSTHYWLDQYKQLHAEKKLAEGSLKELKSVYNDMISQKATELRIKENQIQGLVSFNSTQRIKLDSLVNKYGRFDTSYSKSGDTIRIIQYIPVGTVFDIKDSLSITQYVKKKGFLKLGRVGMLDVVSHAGTVTGLQGFRLKTIEPPLKVRPVVSAVHYDDKWIPAAGVALEFKLGKLPVVISVQKGFK